VLAGTHTSLGAARLDYVLQMADTNLILGQRLSEWVGHAPAIEEDLGFANTALDLMGLARLLLTYAGELEGLQRTEDDLAFLREEGQYRNLTLAEQPNGDFGHTVVRQVLIDAYQLELYTRLQQSTDARLAAIAAKAVKETQYHLRYSASWLIRLGDGTQDSHDRVQQSLIALWPLTVELFDESDADRALSSAGIAPVLSEVKRAWDVRVDAILIEAALSRPKDSPFRWQGRRGVHTEHLGLLLTELQYMQRSYPGAQW
jgi:ring-1,2-phenylacetyl-CoA epoxidase subunit PaaC